MSAQDLLALTIIGWATRAFREAIYGALSYDEWARAYYVQIDCVMFSGG